MQPKLNWEKFKALVHYICAKAEDPAVLGSIKLNKVLWYSDMVHYMTVGQSITGETYVKRQHGPVPRHVMTAVDELIAERKVARGKVNHFGHMKAEYIAIMDSDKSLFSGEEIALVDEAFEHVCMRHTAMSVSKETHTSVWEMADIGEVMPYESVFASEVGEVDEEDIAWGLKQLETA